MGIQHHGHNFPTCFASCSIPSYFNASLPEKLNAIRNAGFGGIEMSMPDILAYSEHLNGEMLNEDDFDGIASISTKIRDLVEDLGLRIVMLQPFSRFEGWSKSEHSEERVAAFRRARGWIRVMESLGTDMLQVGSSDADGISSSLDDLAADLSGLADMLAERGFRLAYENWCWATHAPLWKDVWQIIRRASRPNIGLCLDTFQTAGGEYGDPSTASGVIEEVGRDELDARWKHSMAEMASAVRGDEIFLLQISDAYKMTPPLCSDGDEPRCAWSHDYRPLPFDGGYLPIQDVLGAVLRTGFSGWLSIEVFDSKPKEGMSMEDFTKAAMESLKRLVAP